MQTVRVACCLLWTVLLTGCPIPNYVTHYQAEMKPLASCRVEGGIEECLEPADGGTTLTGSLSLDERGDSTRVFFRQEVLVGSSDSDRLHAEKTRETVYEQSGCLVRQHLVVDGWMDDPGFGLQRQIVGTMEESTISDGANQVCGVNLPFGEIRRYQLHAVEVSQP